MAGVPGSIHYPGSITVEAVARSGGKSLNTIQTGAGRTLLLTQPSIVRLHASPESVARYERHGNDLILHMQDGSTLICKNYFLTQDGDASELVFDDGASITHASFPAAAPAGAITPQFDNLATIEPLLTGHGQTVAYITSALGALAFGGLIAAAGSGGGGGGGKKNSAPAERGDISLGVLAGDNALNAAEAAQGLTISGVSHHLPAGALITVTLNGVSYQTVAQADGSWQLTLSPEQAQALPDGSLRIVASATDAAGNVVTGEGVLQVAVHTLPAPTVDAAFGDNLLNLAESQTAQPLTGTTGVSGAGQTVTVDVGGQIYSAQVDADGRWSLTLSPEQLSQIAQGALAVSVTATDAYGNSGVASASMQVDTQPPPVTINPLTGDNTIYLVETLLPITISGTSEPGAQLVINYNNQIYNATADGDGNWQVTLAPNTLSEMANGIYPLSVTASDAAGNTASATESVVMQLQPPQPTLNTPFGDGFLNSNDVNQTQLLTGTSGTAGDSQTVIVNIGGIDVREHTTALLGSDGRWQLSVGDDAGGNTYIANVDANGNWSLELPPEVLQQFANGELSITVIAGDGQGNIGAAPQGVFDVDTLAPELTINPVTGDDILNALEAQSDLTLTGGSVGLESGQQVSVLFNGVTHITTSDANGNWSVIISSATLQSLPEGVSEFSIAAHDLAGNLGTLNHLITVDTELSLTVNAVAGDDIINAQESQSAILLSGTASVDMAGHTVTLTLNGVNYTASVLSDGSWSTAVPPEDLTGLSDGVYTLSATLSDPAGNVVTVPHTFTLDAAPATLPTLLINSVADDNYINASEHGLPLLLTGSTTNVEAGQLVTLNFAGTTITAVVGDDGAWSVEIPVDVVSALGDGVHLVTGEVSDISGNREVAAGGFRVDTQVELTVDAISSDDVISGAEAASDVTISGTAPAILDIGRTVTVTLNNVTYSAIVQSDGSWTTTVPAADIAVLADGPYTVNATLIDAAGNTLTVPHSVTVDTTATLVVNPVATDDIINAAEAGAGATVTGTADAADAGLSVTVTLNGVNYNGVIQPDGSWSAAIPAADLALLANGAYPLSASFTDASGNSGSASHNVTVDKTVALTINPVATDDTVNAAEAGAGVALSGTADVADAGHTVTLTLGALNYTATVQSDGSWSVTLPGTDLTALTSNAYTINATLIDAAGNSVTVPRNVIIDAAPATLPTLTIAPISGDSYLNALEAASPLPLSGSTTNVEQGQTVTLSLNGQTYSATVAADGSWTVDVPVADLNALADGLQTVTASVSDAAGNPATASGGVTLITEAANLPSLTVNPVTADDVINFTEAGAGVAISGASTHLQPGQAVNVTLNGLNYTGSIGDDGSWSVAVPSADAQALTEGAVPFSVSSSDIAGNPATANDSVTVDRVVTLTVDPVATDDVIDATEAAAGVAVSGTADLADAGQIVTVTLNEVSYTATVQSNGAWSATVPAADLAVLADGPYTFNASLTDAAGNAISAPHNVTLETSAPALAASATGLSIASLAQTENESPETAHLAAFIQNDVAHYPSGETQAADYHYSIGGVTVAPQSASGASAEGQSAPLSVELLGLQNPQGDAESPLAMGLRDLTAQTEPVAHAAPDAQATPLNAPDGMWDFSGQQAAAGQLVDIYHNSALGAADPPGDVLVDQTIHARIQ